MFVAELNNAAQLQYELNNPTKYMSLKNWAYICLNNYCVASIQGNTYIAYERLIRMHFGELRDMPIGRITNLIVQNHITKLSRLVDEMVFEYAVQNNLITHNPANGVRIPKTGIFENRAITKEEADRLIQAVRNSDCLVMFSVILCLFTGLRRGEILGLKWCDVDFERRSISVNKQLVREYKINIGGEAKMHYDTKQPKTKNARRTIHMIEPLAKEFEEYKEKLLQWKAENGFVHSEDDFVFPSKINTGLGFKTFYRHYQ